MLKMSDIATRAGVSPTTVSFVLNDRHTDLRISEKTRNKVLQAAEELGYRSNHLARAMRTGNTQMLGALGGGLAMEQVGGMLAGALEEADACGYTLKILRFDSFDGSAQQVIRRCSELRLMGVLALHLPPETLEQLYCEARRYGYPLALMDASSENADLPQVMSDDASGIATGIDHLVKLGHRKIAFISGEDGSSLSALREIAFVKGMRERGLDVPEHYVLRGDFYFREPSIEAATSLLTLSPGERPTAIFAAGDFIALAVLQVAHKLNLSVPTDLSVIGFANMNAAQFSIPPLTTLEQPFHEMGRVAARLLLDIVEERNREEGASESVVPPKGSQRGQKIARQGVQMLPTRLIERQSTAPPFRLLPLE